MHRAAADYRTRQVYRRPFREGHLRIQARRSNRKLSPLFFDGVTRSPTSKRARAPGSYRLANARRRSTCSVTGSSALLGPRSSPDKMLADATIGSISSAGFLPAIRLFGFLSVALDLAAAFAAAAPSAQGPCVAVFECSSPVH